MTFQTIPIDAVLLNGRFHTMEAPGHWVEALAVAGGRIVARGDTDSIRALAPHAPAYDCEGRAALPGFIDSHCHPDMRGARIGRWIDLSDPPVESREALLRIIRDAARGKPADYWIAAYRFDDRTGGGYPTIEELDQAGEGRGVFVYRRDSQMGVANSAALAAVGLTGDVDPRHGRIERDPATGRPTGLLRARAAHMIVERIQASYTADDFRRGLAKVLDDYLSYGVTSIHNSLTQTQAISAYQTMRGAGELKARIGILASGRDDDLVRAIVRAGLQTGFGDEWVKLIGLEWVGDGSTSGRTAAYYEPYRGAPVLGEAAGNRGAILLDRESFAPRVAEAHRAGLIVATDAIGDRAIDFVLDIYEDVLREFPRDDHRLRIEHCCAVTPAIRERLKRLGIICSSATGFAHDLGDAYLETRGFESMRHMWPHRAMIDDGVIAPGHSDDPVCSPNPFLAISSMVNRKTASGASIDASQAVSVFEAIDAYTRLGAYAGKEEALKGDLGTGKLADVCVLDRDPFAIPAEELSSVRTVATFVGGALVHDARS